jgi:hypothetical protein
MLAREQRVGRIHKTVRVMPAMESNLTDHVWDLGGVAGIVSLDIHQACQVLYLP